MKISFYLLGVIFLFACNNDIQQIKEFYVDTSNYSWSEYKKNKHSSQILSNYESSFNTTISRTNSGMPVNYPAYFGGFYIDDNNDPVIYITDLEYKDYIQQQIGNDHVIIKQCKYSYKTLLDIMEQVNKTPANDLRKTSAHSIKLDVINNRVEVEMNDCSPEKIEQFKIGILDSQALHFTIASNNFKFDNKKEEIKLEGKLEEHILYPGSPITCKEDGKTYTGSMGYRAKCAHMDGFVTSGHFTYDEDTIYLGDVPVAICMIAAEYESVDAAFCKLLPGYTVSDHTINECRIIPQSQEIIVGEFVEMQARSLVRDLAKILHTDITTVVDNPEHHHSTWIKNCILVDRGCNPGDSGGIVYSSNTWGEDPHFTVGIIAGSNTKNKEQTLLIRATKINNMFNLIPY